MGICCILHVELKISNNPQIKMSNVEILSKMKIGWLQIQIKLEEEMKVIFTKISSIKSVALFV